MNLKTEHLPHYSRISIIGDLDANSSVQADEAFRQILISGVKNLHINLEELNYISSAGIGVILSHQDEIEARKGMMIFSGLNAKVLNVFQILGLDLIFKIVPHITDVEEFFNT